MKASYTWKKTLGLQLWRMRMFFIQDFHVNICTKIYTIHICRLDFLFGSAEAEIGKNDDQHDQPSLLTHHYYY